MADAEENPMKKPEPASPLVRGLLASLALLVASPTFAEVEVGITTDMAEFEVRHGDERVTVTRDQDTFATIDLDYAQIARPCPPFCIQPMSLGRGVETLGELEFIDYLRQTTERDDLLIIDSRTPREYRRGTIPGAINIPWDRLHFASGADPDDVRNVLSDRFDVVFDGDFYDFSHAKTLVLFCNGPWCGQSPTNIRTLTNLGYPAERIKWYRGGMQMWHAFGLTTVEGSTDE
ncbi:MULTISPECIES: rhodanese-like domain-containing protein [unclassified Thioalkalivibrio]|uniref:rhodanese-like domain-containing protein n=1 Tax=unclassified Thioalkalivibrio TaxID=2621013 RepID=UPI00035F879F|nr:MULTISPECIES: rhodanese-like domain-containing protein [unclassified Thioalkalivibrio]